MRCSIRMKITMMVAFFATFVVGASWILCNFFIEDIFVYNVKRNLRATYDSCNSFFEKYNNDYDGDLFGDIYNPTESIILIFNNRNAEIYTSINDKSKMMESLNSILDSMQEPNTISRSIYSKYIITKNHDSLNNADYYDLIGNLDNGYSIIVRSPVSRIDMVIKVVKDVFTKIAIGLIVFSSIFILAFSNIFASPIKKLNNAAKRMTRLEFDAKVPVDTKDEIGELGSSMNAMSEKLEATISELKNANIRLQNDIEKREKLDDMRRDFLSHVSHELKTPIALIQGYAEGLQDNLACDEESRRFYTDVIIDEAHKMNNLVMRLLDLNEIEFGESPLNIKRFELVQFLKDIIGASQILIDDSDAVVEFDEKEPVYVWADEYMIEEVFTNYFVNACHYVKRGGLIRVFIEKKESDIRVNVYNQGDCIPESDIGRIFEKFYKVDKARTREYGGSGIGLSIVAATMNAHGKDYGVYNVEDGVVFYFDLDANMP